MGALFIAGNGFDIAHGIPTTYGDFRNYVIDQYPEAITLRNEVVYLNDLLDIDPIAFSAEILLNAMDKAAGENWSNFEEALATISFNAKLPKPNHKENETEEEDHELMSQYLLYMDMLTSAFIKCSSYWQILFSKWIRSIQDKIEKHQFLPKENLKALLSNNDMLFFTFNYTKTLQELYGISKITHIHNRVGQKLIFGHGNEKATYGQGVHMSSEEINITSSFLDDMIGSFQKDTISPLKKYRKFFQKLDHNVNEVYSYGFSYGSVDSVYIKRIVERIAPDTTWFFTEYESKDTEALRIKKIKLRRYGFKGKFGLFQG